MKIGLRVGACGGAAATGGGLYRAPPPPACPHRPPGLLTRMHRRRRVDLNGICGLLRAGVSTGPDGPRASASFLPRRRAWHHRAGGFLAHLRNTAPKEPITAAVTPDPPPPTW